MGQMKEKPVMVRQDVSHCDVSHFPFIYIHLQSHVGHTAVVYSRRHEGCCQVDHFRQIAKAGS